LNDLLGEFNEKYNFDFYIFNISLNISIRSTAPNIQEIRISLDSVWVVIGGILVFFMQAGFALMKVGQCVVKIPLMY
jgi:hypothetical protein